MEIEVQKDLMEVMPLAFIYKALGGFTQSLQQSDTIDKAKAIEQQLCTYMRLHNLSIEVARTGKGSRLIFAKQTHCEPTNDL